MLTPAQQEEYAKELVLPFCKERKLEEGIRKTREFEITPENFDKYIKALLTKIFLELKKVGIPLDYEISTGEQSPAMAKITPATERVSEECAIATISGLGSGTGQGYGFGMSLGQTMRLEMRHELLLIQELQEKVSGEIEIEKCDEILAAYISAFSAALHEIGHHVDWESEDKTKKFLTNLGADTLAPKIIMETVVDRIGELLGREIFPKRNRQQKKRLYWMSRLALLQGFCVRLDKGLYDFEA